MSKQTFKMSQRPEYSPYPSAASSRSVSPSLHPGQRQFESRGRDHNVRDLSSSGETLEEPVRRRNRRTEDKNRKSNQGLGIPGLDDIGENTRQVGRVGETVGNVASGVGNAAAGVAGGGERDNKDTLKLRLDLNLDVAVELKARVHGDVTLSLL